MMIIFCTGVALGAMLYAYTPELFRTANTKPSPNLISVSTRIDTAGQPSEQQLIGLKQAGYDMVIKLAPPDAPGSIEYEGALFTFLYSVVHEHADVDEEYEKVTLIWSPEPDWLGFANSVMSDHQIEFEAL